MILPENKNKKYIKVVIGVYILFTIISPVVGKNFDLSDYNLDNYLNIESSQKDDTSDIHNSNVQKMFKEKIIYNIKSQLKNKGYEAKNINIVIDEDCNVKKIEISDVYEIKENNENSIVNINAVEIKIEDKETKGISTSDKDEIKDLEDSIEDLLDDYTIKVKKIVSVRKEGKNLYRVKAKIEAKEKGEKGDTSNQVFYVMKKGFKCYVVGSDFYNFLDF